MKKLIQSVLCLTVALLCSVEIKASVNILKTQGWFESGCVTWTAVSGQTYTVYVRPEGGSYTQLDNELIRNYGSYGRADMVGLKAGKYQFKVVASNGDEAESAVFTATAHDRNGFAHVGMTGGIGAYKNDGTLKDGAKVLYVYANNAKTVSTSVVTSSKGTTTTATGLQDIIYYYQKGYETTPLDIRIIGTIKNTDMDRFDSSAEGLQVKGKGNYSDMPITIEGIGDDAAIWGFGILVRNAKDVEFRNFAIMLCMDDCLSLDTGNSNIWVHNMDFFYGNTGGDADQAKGDGTVDVKGKSMNVTVAYNHFYDSGKSSLGGMKSETTDCWMTYHHNWFDHSDSRHPRIRTAFYHVYNNYFDGNAKYGVGVTCGGSSFVESNYFRNCKYPMLISKQGTDATGDGTFSGEAGGVIKAYNNFIKNPKQVWYYDGKQTDGKWDAAKTDTRDASVTATAYSGGTSYNNAADAAAIKAVPASAIDDPEQIPTIVRGELGAGRMNHGDFTWTFLNSVQDTNYGVITELKSALQSYKSTLVGFFTGVTSINNGGATTLVNGGDGVGVDQETNDSFTPSWGSGTGGDESDADEDEYEEEAYIANADGTDYYWVGEHVDEVNKMITDGIITLTAGVSNSYFSTDYTNITYKKDSSGAATSIVQCETEHAGSLQLGKASAAEGNDGGYVTIYCPNGVTSFEVYTYRTGTTYYKVLQSTDGTNFTTKGTISKAATGICENDFSAALRDTEATPCWIRIQNTSTGGLNVQGLRICQVAGADVRAASDLTTSSQGIDLKIGETYNIVKGTDFTTSSTGAISYTSSNSRVASVNADGQITALTEGTAVLLISQAKDDNYKAGSISITVNVTDPRSASSFVLTSDASVTIKKGKTSKITTSGAAGKVTYTSNDTDVATVNSNGLIEAIATGTATITVLDPGTDAVKAASYTVTVSVIKDMTYVVICSFDHTSKTPSSEMVTVSGNYSNSKGTVTYNGTDYPDCVKMESATEIDITPAGDCQITLIFGGSSSAANKNIKMDGTKTALDSDGKYTFEGTAGKTYKLTKGDSVNLFLIVFEPKDTETSINSVSKNANENTIFDLNGHAIQAPSKGQIYIQNGKKMKK